MIALRSKKNALVMFFETWPHDQLDEVAALDAQRGVEVDLGALDGRGQDVARGGHRRALERLRRFAGNAGSIAASAGVDGVPPGIR